MIPVKEYIRSYVVVYRIGYGSKAEVTIDILRGGQDFDVGRIRFFDNDGIEMTE